MRIWFAPTVCVERACLPRFHCYLAGSMLVVITTSLVLVYVCGAAAA